MTDTVGEEGVVVNNLSCGRVNCGKWMQMDSGVIVTGDSVAVRVTSIQ